MADEHLMTEDAPRSRPKTRLGRSTLLVSSMTMLSRLLGFVRDVMIAHWFGAGAAVDAFWIAFKIPNFMRRLFAEGAFSQAFVPVLAEQHAQRSPQAVQNFIAKISGLLTFVLACVTVLAVLASPLFVMLFAPGFWHDPHRFHLASQMLRLTFPYLFFISLTAFAGGILNTYGNFWVPSFTPVLLNIALISAAVGFSHWFTQPIYALALGVFIAGVLQYLFQWPFLKRINCLVWPKWDRTDAAVRKVLRLIVPALFGASVAQINLLIDTVFASFLPVGSVSWLYYSDRLSNFPLGVFGVAMATVVLPHLSRTHAQADHQRFTKTVDWGMRAILLIALPAALGLFVLAGPLLLSLFQYGAFTVQDAVMARRSLLAFAWGVPAFMLIKVLASAYYAQQDIRTPVRVGLLAMFANMGLNIILIKPLAHAGLALATTLSAYLNAALLLFYLWRRQIYQPQPGWSWFITQLGTALVTLMGFLWWFVMPFQDWVMASWHTRIGQVLAIVGGAAVVYFVVLRLMGLNIKAFLAQEQ